MDTDSCLIIIVEAALLLLFGGLTWMFASIEAVLVALSQDDVEAMETARTPADNRVLKCLQHPEKLWCTLKTLGVLLHAATVLLCFSFANAILADATLVWLAVLIALLAMLFVEGLANYPSRKRVLRWLANVMPLLIRLLTPLTCLLMAGFKHRWQQRSLSIGQMLEKADSKLENENILKGVVKFGNMDVHSIMKSRIDVETVCLTLSFAELTRFINECGYSRLPVLDERDYVKGILYVKDLLPFMHEDDNFNWKPLIRDAYFVPENKKIDDLLKEFQDKKIHIAVVVDEYGSMAGIVTLEDILEEIVGDIADESDDEEPSYRQTGHHTYLCDGKMLLNDFYRIIGVDDAVFDDIRGDADTLAGIILELKGEIPHKGDAVSYGKFSFYVEEMENRRIKQIKVEINE